MKAHQLPIGKNDEWLTPPDIIKSLGAFDLDPCAPVVRPWDTAKIHYTIDDDGLSKEWVGRVWCNPPFSRKERHLWMEKMSEHGNGILLIPANMETKAFKKNVWGKADGILILNSRPHFHYVDGSRAKANSGATICLVAYGKDNLVYLLKSGLGIVLYEATIESTFEKLNTTTPIKTVKPGTLLPEYYNNPMYK